VSRPVYRRLFGETLTPEARPIFEQELKENAATGLLVVSALACMLFPAFAVLDRLLYPEQIAQLTAARFSTTAVGLVFLLIQFGSRRRGTSPRYARAYSWAFVIIYSAGLDAIIHFAGGMGSSYYAAIILLLMGITVGLPWGLREVAAMLTVVVLQFNIAMWALNGADTWQVSLTTNYFLISAMAIGLFSTALAQNLRIKEFLSRQQLKAEMARSETLLLNILPDEVAAELKSTGRVEARQIDSCTILFTDFVGFTAMSEKVSPTDLVLSLDQAFRAFDRLMSENGLEKLKTVGDAYMCAGGVLGSQPDHLVASVLTGLLMIDELQNGEIRRPDGERWTMRVGIHSGPVVAGVIGDKKFAYDLWGDTVNTASRMESTAQPHTVNMTSDVYKRVAPFFVGTDRGAVPVRGKGTLAMTHVSRLRPEYSADTLGRRPNAAFRVALEAWLANGGAAESPEGEGWGPG
jgi:class 3 adenylate cyclase